LADLIVHCPGTPGHGSLLLPDTAGEKVRIIIDHFMDFREQERKKLVSNPSLTVADVTTVNLTQLKVIMIVFLVKHSFNVSGYET
jgi:aminoacylase